MIDGSIKTQADELFEDIKTTQEIAFSSAGFRKINFDKDLPFFARIEEYKNGKGDFGFRLICKYDGYTKVYNYGYDVSSARDWSKFDVL